MTQMGTPTWKDSYVLPYETDWSVIQKKGYLDGYSVKIDELYRLQRTTLASDRCIPDYDSLNPWMRYARMRYCPICARHGYVSIMHQYAFLDNCFIHHNESLLEANIPKTVTSPTSFYEEVGARAIDVMANEEFRNEIVRRYPIDFDGFTVFDLIHRYFYSFLIDNDKLRKAMAQRFLTGQFPSYVRKVATIHSSKKDSNDVCFENDPFLSRIITEINSMQNYISKSVSFFRRNPEETLYFSLYKEYDDLCKKHGGEETMQEVFYNIKSQKSSIVSQNNRKLYGRCIVFAMISNYLTTINFKKMKNGYSYVSEIPSIESGLNLIYNKGIDVLGKNKLTEIEIAMIHHRIKDDLLNNLSIKIGNELIREEFKMFNWFSNNREFPVDAYIAIRKNDEIELWACDTKGSYTNEEDIVQSILI